MTDKGLCQHRQLTFRDERKCGDRILKTLRT